MAEKCILYFGLRTSVSFKKCMTDLDFQKNVKITALLRSAMPPNKVLYVRNT
jgi:hypothetical protein